jgi:hypothetical protein
MSNVSPILKHYAKLGHTVAPYKRPSQAPSFRQTLINAAKNQLKYLDQRKTPDQLNYPSRGQSGKYWWSSVPVDNMRIIRHYVSRKRLCRDDQLLYVPNDPAEVKKAIQQFITIVESLPDSEIEQLKLDMQKPTQH